MTTNRRINDISTVLFQRHKLCVHRTIFTTHQTLMGSQKIWNSSIDILSRAADSIEQLGFKLKSTKLVQDFESWVPYLTRALQIRK